MSAEPSADDMAAVERMFGGRPVTNATYSAYCVQDNGLMQMKNAIIIDLKNGKPAVKGECRNGHPMFRIGLKSNA